MFTISFRQSNNEPYGSLEAETLAGLVSEVATYLYERDFDELYDVDYIEDLNDDCLARKQVDAFVAAVNHAIECEQYDSDSHASYNDDVRREYYGGVL